MHFQVLVGEILTKISFVFFDIVVKTNEMWFSMVCTLIDNDTRHHSGQNLSGGVHNILTTVTRVCLKEEMAKW